jgi:hypothetical protein
MKQNEVMRNRLAGSLGSALSGGKLKIYNGTIPSDVDAIITNTLLCEITLPSPCFGVIPANGQVIKTGTWSGTVIANGTAGWAKLQSSATTQFIFITVGESGTELIINDSALVIGWLVTINTGIYTVPAQ